MKSFTIELFYLFFQGILIFQAFVFVVIYFITHKKDILYYSLFLFAAAAYFFINAPYTFFNVPEETVWKSIWYEYVNTPVIIIENFFYLLFLRAFFADITNNKAVVRVFRHTIALMPLLLLLFILLTTFKLDKQFIFYTVKMITVFPAIVVAYTVIKQRLPFAGLVANGLLCTIVGTSVTVLMIICGNNGIDSLFTTGYPLFFIRLGLLGDMIFYLTAILKKWHCQEKQLAVEKIQSQLEVEKLRNKISGDLHDDIGSTLSGVSMYSYMASTQLLNGEHENLKTTLQTIQQSASEVVNKLGDLVWSVKPGKDTIEVLIEKIEQYARDMCRAKNIDFTASITVLTNTSLTQEKRYHLFLCMKEAINNAVKYSEADLLELTVKEYNQLLEITIRDNGKGFDVENVKRGNGLDNMQQRVDELGAEYLLKSEPGKGTCVCMWLKMPE